MKKFFMFDLTRGSKAAYIGGFMKLRFMFDYTCGYAAA